jgi:DNA invertase Pin-like site-specific DNA recombinase
MVYPELKGRRAILWIRCSSLQQASTSMDDQERACRKFAEAHGIEIVAVIRMPGKSASIRKHVQSEVERLVARKKIAGDFDCILVYDLSRFTRTTPRHAMRMLDDLDAARISLVPVVGYVRRNDFSDLSDVYSFFMNREHARRIAAGVARGSQSSLEQGRRAHCGQAPYAIDKLILASDGRPVHRLRDLPDGSQLRMDPKTQVVLETYPPNRSGETSSHYRKTKEQRVQLVPGDPAAVQVLRQIFEQYHIARAGYWKIAKALNEQGTASPGGGLWSVTTVQQILANPTYRGVGLANRTTSAIYYKRRSDLLEAAEPGRETPEGRPAQCFRPRQDWLVLEYPELVEFLPEHVRELADQHQEGRLLRDAGGRVSSPRKDKHGASEFLLKNILTSKQGGHPMTGKPASKHYRYYQVARAQGVPTTDATLRRRIRAEHVEEAAVRALTAILERAPVEREEVIRQTVLWQKQQSGRADRKDIEKQIGQLDREMSFLVKQIHRLGEEAAEAQLAPLAEQRAALARQLERPGELPELSEQEIADVADAVIAGLSDMATSIDSLPKPELRRLLEVFIESAVVDLETGAIELTMAVPNWAAVASGTFGLDSCPVYSGVVEDKSVLAFYRHVTVVEVARTRGRRKAA